MGRRIEGIIPQKLLEQKIFLIRGHRVMLDEVLAGLYGVPTKVLIQAVKRHKKRFPEDFMFLLTKGEFTNLRSQFVTSSWGGRRYLPYAFTEQGIAMLSSVLNSERAIHVNIAVMRTFVKIRQFLSVHKELEHKFKEFERKFEKHDREIQAIFAAIRQLMAAPPETPKRRIGFHPD